MTAEAAPVAHDILVFGRGGSIQTPAGWELSPTGIAHVEAVVDYVRLNQSHFQGAVRVQFSAGWIGGEDQVPPPPEDREGALMLEYAKQLGLMALTDGGRFAIELDAQSDSCTTLSDAVKSARSGFFGKRPFGYSPKNPLGVVAHPGDNGEPGHLDRCLLAAQKAFRVSPLALLPIPALGEDIQTAGISETDLLQWTRIATLGAISYRSLLWREKSLLFVAHFLQQHSKQ